MFFRKTFPQIKIEPAEIPEAKSRPQHYFTLPAKHNDDLDTIRLGHKPADISDLLFSPSDIIDLEDKSSIHCLSFLGEGTFAKVYFGIYKDKNANRFPVAIKQFNDNDNGDLEIAVMHELQALESPYLVKMIAYSSDALMLEYMQNGTLLDFINQHDFCDWGQSLQILADCWAGLAHMHQYDFIHLDIKLENIFLNQDNRAKLGDFGLTARVTDSIDAIQGSPIYLAPEIIKCLIYSKKADIHSLGVVMLAIAAWDNFDDLITFGESGINDFDSILKSGSLDWSSRSARINKFIDENCPIDIGQLIKECMQISHRDRPTAETVSNRLNKMNKIHGEVRQLFFTAAPAVSDKIAGITREYCHEMGTRTP